MSLFDGTVHLQSDQFDRLMSESAAYRAQSDLWRKELAAWRDVVAGLPDNLKATVIGSLAEAVGQVKRVGDFLDRIEIYPPKKSEPDNS